MAFKVTVANTLRIVGALALLGSVQAVNLVRLSPSLPREYPPSVNIITKCCSESLILQRQQHVNEGCIYIDEAGAGGSSLCEGSVTGIEPNLNIYACVDSTDGKAGCMMTAAVPVDWADAFFGADNCLYSAGDSRKFSSPPSNFVNVSQG